MTIDAPAPALAIDIGGTTIDVGLVTSAGHITSRRTIPTPPSDAESLFTALTATVDQLLAEAHGRPVVCGVGCGGPMEPGGATVSPLNIPQWRGFELRARIAEHTGLVTWVDNDAKALALAEGWCGGAQGVADYLSMVVSTGVGGGIVIDGKLLDGALGNAGHIGHVIVEPNGERCPCGAIGCLEAEASGTAIRRITGRPAAEAPAAVRIRTGRLVGRAVASVANLLDLQLATVAGSVALGFGTEFFDAAQAELDERCRLDFSRGTRIIASPLGADGPILGAAAVAWRGSRVRP